MLRTCCETCHYWVPQTEDGRGGRQALGLGQCRRQPPQVMLTPAGARALWRIVNRTDWCGEHATVQPAEG